MDNLSRLFAWWLFAVCTACLLPGTASAEEKLALLIGNSAYQKIGVLANPSSDVKLMSRVLAEQGFKADTHIDLDLKRMKRALQEFFGKVQEAGKDAVVFIYYAGHGVQVRGVNYLIPVDAEIDKETDVEIESVSADSLMQMIANSGAGLNVIILDACRNNPFRGFRSAGRGLAQIDAPSGTLVAFSTAPGQVARDGPSGGNSPYTQALSNSIKEPGLRIEEVFKRTRQRVNAATQGTQIPWESSSLVGDFYPAGLGPVAVMAPPAPEARKVSWRLASSFPKTMHELGPDPAPVIADIERLSGGNFKMASYPSGQLVPGLEVMNAVLDGRVDAGWTPANFYESKETAFAVASGALPFSVAPEKLIRWVEGPGAPLRDKLYAKHGLKGVACSMMGTAGIWSRVAMEGREALSGKTVRVGGIAAEILRRVGGKPVAIAGSDIYASLQKGEVDAVTFSGPGIDVALGFQKVSQFYYYPSWHEPARIVDLIVKLQTWNALSASDQRNVETACSRNLPRAIVEVVAKERDAVAQIRASGAKVAPFTTETLEPLRKAALQVYAEQSEKYAEFKALWESLKQTK